MTPLWEMFCGKATLQEIKSGDMVQYVSGGIKQFQKPREVKEIREFEGTRYAFFDHTNTGIPTNKLERHEYR